MKLNDTYKPVTQADCDHANALREYEKAHKDWMCSSIFDPAVVRNEIKRRVDNARAKYEAAYLAANPNHTILL